MFSDTLGMRKLTDSEIEYGLHKLESLLAQQAPVLLAEFAVQAAVIRPLLGADRTAQDGRPRANGIWRWQRS